MLRFCSSFCSLTYAAFVRFMYYLIFLLTKASSFRESYNKTFDWLPITVVNFFLLASFTLEIFKSKSEMGKITLDILYVV